jgi:hypothetical protein
MDGHWWQCGVSFTTSFERRLTARRMAEEYVHHYECLRSINLGRSFRKQLGYAKGSALDFRSCLGNGIFTSGVCASSFTRSSVRVIFSVKARMQREPALHVRRSEGVASAEDGDVDYLITRKRSRSAGTEPGASLFIGLEAVQEH